MRKVWILGIVAAIGIGIWLTTNHLSAAAAPAWRTAKVERGDLVVAVTATGTLQPVTQVQVGTQVSGTIASLSADFNSRVKKGQVVAELDPATYKARLASDRANLVRSQADVLRVAALLKLAEHDVSRQEALVKDGLVTQQDYDSAIANRDSLLAQQKVADATVEQMQAALELSDVNLKYCTISSPVDGIVVSRNVDVGQTVAASLSAPTLFVIAADLEKMQVQASVAEADIGRIVGGQAVTFDVDAFPGEKFSGTVSQVRIAPTTVQNVVTYTVIVDAPNPHGRLLPGMTANLSFEIERHDDVLMVPDSALRFTPPDVAGDATATREGSKGGAKDAPASPPAATASTASTAATAATAADTPASTSAAPAGASGETTTKALAGGAADPHAAGEGGSSWKNHDHKGEGSHGKFKDKEKDDACRVWLPVADGPPRAMDVKIGVSDGQHTLLLGTELAEGTEVITGVQPSASAVPATTNPFQPQMMGGRPGGGRPRP